MSRLNSPPSGISLVINLYLCLGLFGTLLIFDIGSKINKSNYETAVKIASIPDQIRGFGHVKEKNIKEAINNRTDLLNSFHENS